MLSLICVHKSLSSTCAVAIDQRHWRTLDYRFRRSARRSCQRYSTLWLVSVSTPIPIIRDTKLESRMSLCLLFLYIYKTDIFKKEFFAVERYAWLAQRFVIAMTNVCGKKVNYYYYFFKCFFSQQHNKLGAPLLPPLFGYVVASLATMKTTSCAVDQLQDRNPSCPTCRLLIIIVVVVFLSMKHKSF